EYTFKPGALKKPHFIEGKGGFTAAEKGTIVHFVMQHIDIFSAQSIEDVHNYIKKMTDLSLITEEEAATVDAGIIYGFINSPICKRIIAAGNLHREIPFSINLDIGELTGNEKYKDSDVLLQGIIDCYFIENDEIVILDYKTDYIAKGNEESIKERYSLQLKCYKKALEIIMGKRVKNTYIYLFSNENLLEF
ncbi:MAG TPA: PD-(D/E)XK nuclease family protein, partial [Clostridia bacterium]|nr:PD-(D/E)XK nuclease family protein [Clostridia bacterium]